MDIHPTAAIEPSAYIDRTWPKGIHIGPGCYIGENAVVLTHDMVRGLYLDTYIGAQVTLNPRAIVMPGLRIGDGCNIAAGAVVIKDLLPGSSAVGNPASVASPPEGAIPT